MPTKRTRLSRCAAPQVSPAILSFLSEELFPMPQGVDPYQTNTEWQFFMKRREGNSFGGVQRHHPSGMDSPAAWQSSEWRWQMDAPEKGRRRLGGIGDPAHEALLAYSEVTAVGSYRFSHSLRRG